MPTKLARRNPRIESPKAGSRSPSLPIRIDGIVSDAALAQPGNWYVMFLMPWRHPDGRVIDEELRVAPDVARSVAVAAQRRYRRGVAVRVTAKHVTKGLDRRLKLSTIHVGDGRTTLDYSSGSLFADHGVEVRIGARGVISEILIS
jgi:hypothetical protein